MNIKSTEYLICPNCKHHTLQLRSYYLIGNDVQDGSLTCHKCSTWYRIENGIVDMLPLSLRDNELHKKFATKYKLSLDINQNNITNEKSLQVDFFKKYANGYETDVVNSKYYKSLDIITFTDWMKKNLSPGQLVLELGCGTGRQAIQLAEHKVRTVGIDISEHMLNLTKRKIDNLQLNEYVDLIVGDAEDPPVKDNCFNACILIGTLHHLPNKQVAIVNASKKIIRTGLFYSVDPHKSPIRFIFDFLMRIWKLYDEDASSNPLLSEKQLKQWLSDADIKCTTRLSTYLPPHMFQILDVKTNTLLLRMSDSIFDRIFLIRCLAGVIIAEGIKKI